MPNTKVTLEYISIDNIKKIQHLELRPEGHHILLKGKNERGKTTFLNCIHQAFGIAEITDDMVTRGKDEGKIVVVYKDADGQEMKVERIIKNQKNACSVILRPAKGGKAVPKPATVLRAAAGVYIDAFEIAERERTAKGQRENEELLLMLAKLNLDKIRGYNDDIAKLEQERLEIGRQRDDASGFVDTVREAIDVELYTEKVQAGPIIQAHQEILNGKLRDAANEATQLAETYKKKMQSKDVIALELSELNNKQLQRGTIKQQLDSVVEKRAACEAKIAKLKEELAAEEKDLIKWNDQCQKGEDKLKEFGDLQEKIEGLNHKLANIEEHNLRITQEQSKAVTDLLQEVKEANDIVKKEAEQELELKLKEIEEHNKNVETVEKYKLKVAEFERLAQEWNEKQEKIEKLRKERSSYVRSGEFPVPGLKYDEEKQRITYFENTMSEASLSYGQMLELTVKMQLAYNKNGGLGVVCVPNASLLDGDKRAAVMQMLEEEQMCGFFEVVDDDYDELTIEVVKDENEN